MASNNALDDQNLNAEPSPAPAKRTWTRWVRRLLGLLLLAAIAAGAGEAYLHWINNHGLNDYVERARYYDTMRIEKTYFRNRNDISGKFGGVAVRINGMGCRGRRIPTIKRPAAYRVIMVGDEKTFGWAVPEKKTFPALLQQALDRDYIGKFEVLNAGTPGWDLTMMHEYVTQYLPRLSPDLICVLMDSEDILGNKYRDLTGQLFAEGLYRYSYLARMFHLLLRPRPNLTPDRLNVIRARPAFFGIENLAIGMSIPVILVYWSLNNDTFYAQATAALPQPDKILYAKLIDAQPILAQLSPSQAYTGLVGHYPSPQAHKLLSQLFLDVVSRKASNFIFQRRDGQPAPRDRSPK